MASGSEARLPALPWDGRRQPHPMQQMQQSQALEREPMA
jgi:hypothetical protein